MISLVSAGDLGAGYRSCFQEFANASTLCGGLNSGSYYAFGDYAGFNGNGRYSIDGDYITYTQVQNVIGDSILYINYTKPFNSINATWHIKYSHAPTIDEYTLDLDINESCMNLNTINLRVNKIYDITAPYNSDLTLFQCYNNTDWVNMTKVNDSGYYFFFHEEGINWKFFSLYENYQTFNNLTYETSTENFIINLSYDTTLFQVSTASLNYNGTNYLGTLTSSGTNIIFNKTLDINLINTDGEKKLVYWTIGLTNSTGTYFYNSSKYNQTIYGINLSNDSSLGVKALNFTTYDQKTLSKLSSWNFKGSFNYYLGSGIYYRNFSITSLNIPEQVLYIRNNTNYKLTGTVQYSADGYATTDYNFLNTNINNQTQNISLYLLNLSFSTSFIIKVQDNNQNPLSDYLVYIYRYDAGVSNPYLVQVVKTDSAGKGVGFFETETVDYKFVITDSDGNIVYTSNKRKIIPETTPYTLIFTVGYITPNPLEYYSNLTGMSWSLSYNKNNYLVTYIYTDSNSSFVSSSLIVKYLNSSGIDNLVCNNTIFNPSGVLTCNMTGNLSGTYSATTYVNRGGTSYQVDNLIFNIDTTAQVYGNIGLLIGFMIILICVFTFAFNEIAGIIFVNIGIIFTQIIGLINFGWIFIFAIISISIIIAIILERS